MGAIPGARQRHRGSSRVRSAGQVDELRGAPMNVGTLEEIIDEK